jgi:UDP-N-acetylglucosamine 4-epimerase
VTVTPYEALQIEAAPPGGGSLRESPVSIGSNLVDGWLALEQEVVRLDNFATGYQRNLEQVRSHVQAGAMVALQIHQRRDSRR